MEKLVYLDHAATTATKKEVIEEMIPYFSQKYGNASAIYSIGNQAREALEISRAKVSKLLNAEPTEVYFTSGGSEGDNLAIKGVAYANKNKGNHIITSKIEHHAVLNSCETLEKEGFNVTYLDVDEDGIIDIEQLKKSITDKTILISIMFANNEIGTLQPIEEIGKIAKENNILFHTDAVQAVGNVKIDVKKMNIDLLSMSSHKFYGPKGIGAIYIKKDTKIVKLIDGGHHERNMRAGTENIPGIVGMAKAMELAYENIEENNKHLIELRDYYISEVEKKIPNIKLNGHKTNRLPGNANISFECINGEELLLNLSLIGICASAGSACSAGGSKPSHVLLSIGLSEELARGSLRTTFGIENTKEDIDYVVEKLAKLVTKLRNKMQ